MPPQNFGTDDLPQPLSLEPALSLLLSFYLKFHVNHLSKAEAVKLLCVLKIFYSEQALFNLCTFTISIN